MGISVIETRYNLIYEFYVRMEIKMRRKRMYLIAVISIIFITAVFALFASGADDEANIRFLADCGWEVENRCIESAEVIIPDPFDKVYERYNEMQLKSGFDLRPYMGKKGMRYTYKVTNYPVKVDEDVRANVICIDGKPIGGDICTVSLCGFMHGLKETLK